MEDALLTVDQAAEKLQMHPDTVRRLLREKTLPGVKMGPRQWRVPVAALQKYVTDRMNTSDSQKKAES